MKKIKNGLKKKMPVWARLGMIFGIVLVLGFGGWSGYQTYAARQIATTQPAVVQTSTARRGDLVLYASGTGTLIPATDVTFGFGTSGQVALINVKVGDEVIAGDILAELANATLQSSYEQARRNLAEITSPASIAKARQDVVSADENLQTAQTERSYLNGGYSQALIDNAYAEMVLADVNLTKAQERFDQVATLPVGDSRYASAYTALYNAQNTYAAKKRIYVLYDSYTATLNDIEMGDANVALAQALLNEANHYLAALTAGEVPENATGANLAKLQQAQLALESAQANLNDTLLVAPISGTVMSFDFNVGDVVGSNVTITIADLEQPYTFEVYLDESDWAMVQVGYPVEVTFDLIPDQVFPGKVLEVNPGLMQVGNSNAVRCIVRLEAPIKAILPSGTSATMDVIGGSATQAVLIPVDALREVGDGQYTVFVMQNGEPKLRVVEVGIKDLVSAEIISGLQAGDVVTTGIVETNQ
jgi:RND family efflux transporter MFP subunit